MSEKVGFVGLGIMGRPMARNLVLAGYDLVVNLLRNSDATSDKTPLPRLFFLFALRPYQLSLPKCR